MIIHWRGAYGKIRLLGPYRWDPRNHFTQDVTDPQLAATLLEQHNERFVIDAADPLLRAVGDPVDLYILLRAGILTAEELVGLEGDVAGLGPLAAVTEFTTDQLHAWAEAARAIIMPGQAGREESHGS